MTDKELLKHAAKAADITWTRDYMDGPMIVMEPFSRIWNSLTNDRDAFRMAVKLGISSGPGYDGGNAVAFSRDGRDFKEMHGTDPYAATRRAITRAAAEIGKAMT